VLWRMAIILKADKVNLFVSSVLFVFWYHSPKFLDTPRVCMYVYIMILKKHALAFVSSCFIFHIWIFLTEWWIHT
jgi:hypothetical protein